MSELKAISGNEIREDIDYNTRGIDPEDKEWCNYGKELCYTLYYLKSEADKVIADLEMKLAAAKLVLRLNEPKALYSNLDTMSRLNHKIDVVERRELHQKYKRCLAMANMCESNVIWVKGCSEWRRWKKWHKRWLELAEKFKTN